MARIEYEMKILKLKLISFHLFERIVVMTIYLYKFTQAAEYRHLLSKLRWKSIDDEDMNDNIDRENVQEQKKKCTYNTDSMNSNFNLCPIRLYIVDKRGILYTCGGGGMCALYNVCHTSN